MADERELSQFLYRLTQEIITSRDFSDCNITRICGKYYNRSSYPDKERLRRLVSDLKRKLQIYQLNGQPCSSTHGPPHDKFHRCGCPRSKENYSPYPEDERDETFNDKCVGTKSVSYVPSRGLVSNATQYQEPISIETLTTVTPCTCNLCSQHFECPVAKSGVIDKNIRDESDPLIEQFDILLKHSSHNLERSKSQSGKRQQRLASSEDSEYHVAKCCGSGKDIREESDPLNKQLQILLKQESQSGGKHQRSTSSWHSEYPVAKSCGSVENIQKASDPLIEQLDILLKQSSHNFKRSESQSGGNQLRRASSEESKTLIEQVLLKHATLDADTSSEILMRMAAADRVFCDTCHGQCPLHRCEEFACGAPAVPSSGAGCSCGGSCKPITRKVCNCPLKQCKHFEKGGFDSGGGSGSASDAPILRQDAVDSDPTTCCGRRRRKKPSKI